MRTAVTGRRVGLGDRRCDVCRYLYLSSAGRCDGRCMVDAHTISLLYFSLQYLSMSVSKVRRTRPPRRYSCRVRAVPTSTGAKQHVGYGCGEVRASGPRFRASKRHPCSARCAFALRPVTAAALPRMPAAQAVYPPTHPAVCPPKHPARPAATRAVLLQGRVRRGRASVFGADLGQDECKGEGEGEGEGEG